MYFETEAYLDEYVIGGENHGAFSGDDTSITYTPADQDTWSHVCIPTDEITSVTFKRDTTLQRNRLLGWFFAGITLLLILVVYFYSFAGHVTDPNLDFITLFMCFLVLGGLSTTHEYFSGEDYDIIVTYIRTDDDCHVFTGRLQNTTFVDACGELIESDLETTNKNEKLQTTLED